MDIASKLGELIGGDITPELLEDAMGLLKGGKGTKVQEALKRNGVNLGDLKKKYQESTREERKIELEKPTVKGVFLTSQGTARTRSVQVEDPGKSLRESNVISMRFSSLGIKGLKVFYNPDDKRTNKNATKILGFKVGGSLLFVAPEDIDLREFTVLMSRAKQISH